MAGTISSLGVGSGILTQDVLDQLRKVDEANFITPLQTKINIAANQFKAMGQIGTWMSDLATAAYDLQSYSLYTERSASVTGSGVSVTVAANTDIQSFSVEVVSLAKKTIMESGSFANTTDPIASGSGSMNLNVGGTNYTINYDATTTLESLKNTINSVAGDKAGASIVQLATGDFRLFLSSKETGLSQTMALTDTTGLLSGTQLTTGMSTIQAGTDATFKFNGQTATRSSNVISDLVTGATITLQTEGGTANVDITQNRDVILEKINAFVEKYNTAAGG
ncbi:MAG TPA: flagellar filament capping protein FliD, partial [Sulfuricurvum sp.]|nr:flagellar filament capping protein FliD [Sulfuricurvum sp.]